MKVQWPERAGGSTRTLNLLFIGDSHTAGTVPIHTAITSSDGTTTNRINGYAPLDPRVRLWDSSAEAAFVPANPGRNVAGSSQDPNISGGRQPASSYCSWVAEALAPLVGKVRFANAGIGGSSCFTWAGEQAVSYFEFTGIPADGETVVVNGTTYRFKTTPVVNHDVLRGGSATACAQNLAQAINTEGGSNYFAGTPKHTTVFATPTPSNQYMRMHAILSGTAGNAYTLTGSANISVYNVWGGGSSTSQVYATGKALIAGAGTVDAVAVMLGTNDAARIGYRGTGTQAELTTLLTNLKTDFPSAKILVAQPPTAQGTTEATLAATVRPAITAAIAAAGSRVSAGPDMGSLSTGESGTYDPAGNLAYLSLDGVHLTTLGYQFVAQGFARKIAVALGLVAA